MGMNSQDYPEVIITAQKARLRNLASYLFTEGRYWEGYNILYRLAPDLHEAGLLPTVPIPPLWEALLLSKGLLSPPVQIHEFNHDAFNRFESLVNNQSPLCIRNDHDFLSCRKKYIEISSQKAIDSPDGSLYLSLLTCLDELNISLTRQGRFERDDALHLKALIAQLYGNRGTYLDVQEERLRLYEDLGRPNFSKMELRLASLETLAKFPNGIRDIGTFLGELNKIEKSLENEPNPILREQWNTRVVVLHEQALQFLHDFDGSASKEFRERLSKSDDMLLKAWGGAILAKINLLREPPDWQKEVNAWVTLREALLERYPNISLPKPPPTLSLDENGEPILELREWAKEFGERLSESDDVVLEDRGGAILAKLNVLGEPPVWQRAVDAWVAQREALKQKYPNINLPKMPTLSLDENGEPTLELCKWAIEIAEGAEVDRFEQYAARAVLSLLKLLPTPAKQLSSRTVAVFGTVVPSVLACLGLPEGDGPIAIVFTASSVAYYLSQVPNLGNCSDDKLVKLDDIRWDLEQLSSKYSSESFSSVRMSGYLLASIAELLISATWTLQADWEKVYVHLDKASFLVDKGRSQRSYTNTKETWNLKRKAATEVIPKIIHNVGLYLLLRAGDKERIWDWVQRGKARGLADAMNTGKYIKNPAPTCQVLNRNRSY
jgi:hypothetical protein